MQKNQGSTQNNSSEKPSVVPKLDLSKPKKIQESVVKKQLLIHQQKEKKNQQLMMLKNLQQKNNQSIEPGPENHLVNPENEGQNHL